MTPRLLLLLSLPALLHAFGARAASTMVSVQVTAQPACSTYEECLTNSAPPGQVIFDQQSDPNGGYVGNGAVTDPGTSANVTLMESAGLSTASLGVLEVEASASGDGTVSRYTRIAPSATAKSYAEFTDTLTIAASGTSGGYVTFRLLIGGGLTTSTTGALGVSDAYSSFTVGFQTPATYVPPSQGGTNSDTVKYRIFDAKTADPILETTMTTVRAGVAQPIRQTIEPLLGGIYGDNFVFGPAVTFTQWVPFNVATSFKAWIEATAGGSLGLACANVQDPACDGTGGFSASAEYLDLGEPAPGGPPTAFSISADEMALSAQALSDLPGAARAGLRWGGITSIRNALGQELLGQVSVTSGSGVDYLHEIHAVPAPATLPLLLTAVGAVAGWVRKRRPFRER